MSFFVPISMIVAFLVGVFLYPQPLCWLFFGYAGILVAYCVTRITV